MKNEAQKVVNEVFYKILECCITTFPTARTDIAKHLNIKERGNEIEQLLNSNLIKIHGGNDNFLLLTAEGMSAFLNIQSQKQSEQHSLQSSMQARKAIYIAILSIFIALATLIVTLVVNK